MHDSLAELHDQLDDLEATLKRVLARPSDPQHAAILVFLAQVYDQHRGAYVTINTIAPWATNRTAYRAVSAAVTQLINLREVETIRVAFGQSRQLLVRLIDENGPNLPDGFGIGNQLAALLADLNYEVEVTRSRDIGTNFTKITVTHDGKPVDAWVHSWPFNVTVRRTEVKP